jgi:hypothetical protein
MKDLRLRIGLKPPGGYRALGATQFLNWVSCKAPEILRQLLRTGIIIWLSALAGILFTVWSHLNQPSPSIESLAAAAIKPLAEKRTITEELGYSEVYILEGGWPAWQKAGLPLAVGEDSGI